MFYPSYRLRPFFLLLSLMFAVACFGETGAGLSRTAPPIYEELIEPLVTTIESLLLDANFLDSTDADNVVLLDERVVFITNDGTIFEVLHYAYKAMTEGNISGLSDDIFSFRPDTQRLHLLTAETIQPDGHRLPVREEGIILQTPQRAADHSVFTGRRELRLVYPALRAGSVTHSIILRETSTHRIPGEWSQVAIWDPSWPTRAKRTVLDLSPSFAKRLHITTLGDGVPEPSVVESEGDRTRWIWERNDLAARRWEPNGSPVLQTGPALFLTTLPDWNAFSAWYSSLLRDSSSLTDELQAKAREWVGDALSEEDIIARLFRIAAREIRYTSIDFGYGGLQPQPSSSVWENGYGDCKDKSNFLRLLLRQHGIAAYFGLINTRHLGRVETRSADYRHFDHAIVVIEQADGSLLFCDPTIKYGWPGLLTPRLADRPVLLIDPESDTARWVSTPPVSAGALDYEFDLDLTDALEFSGWLTIEAEGYYSAHLQERFEARERDALTSEIGRYVRYFFGGAELIDFEKAPAPKGDEAFSLRAFFVADSPGIFDDGEATIAWPDIGWLLPDIGERRRIDREAYAWNDSVTVAMTVRLGDKWYPARLPASLQSRTGSFTSFGAWSFDSEKKVLAGSFQVALERARIDPVGFPSLFQAVEATRNWLGQSPRFTRSGEANATAGKPVDPLDDLTLMPTGAGQLALVDRLYPTNRKPDERRRALEKVQQWFGNDPQTRFNAAVRIGWIDWDQGDEEASLRAARRLIKDYAGIVSLNELGWARFLEARSLQDLGRGDEALRVFNLLASDSELTDFRRSWARFHMGEILADEQPKEAFAAYVGSFHFDAGNQLLILPDLAELALRHRMESELSTFLRESFERYPSSQYSFLQTLLELGRRWVNDESADQTSTARLAVSLHVVLGDAEPPPATDPLIVELRAELAAFHELITAGEEIRRIIRDRIDNDPPVDWPDVDLPPTLETHEDYDAAIKEAEAERIPDLALRLAVDRLLRFQPDARFPFFLWKAASQADWRERFSGETKPDELFDFLLSCGQSLPLNHDGTIDSYYLRALYWERREEHEKADKVYRELEEMDLDSSWHRSLFTRMGRNRERAGDCAGALAAYSKLFNSGDLADRTEGLIRGVFILLERGEFEEAADWVARVAVAIDEENEVDRERSLFLHWNTLRLEGRDQEFWEVHEGWWPAWEELARGLRLSPTPEEDCFVPVIDDATLFAGELGGLAREGVLSEVGERLRIAVHAARWEPEAILNTQSLVIGLASILPEHGPQLRRLAVALFESARDADLEVGDQARLNYLVALADLGEHRKAANTVDRFLAERSEPDAFTRAVERLGGHVATQSGAERTRWISRMEAHVAAEPLAEREFAVHVLSGLYSAEGETEKEIELLAEFLAGPAGESSRFQTQFRNRLATLRQQSGDRGGMEEALTSWMEKAAPVWLRYTPPFDLDSFDPQRLGALTAQPPSNLSSSGRAKLLFLLCKDPRVTADEANTGFSSLLTLLMEMAAEDQEWDRLSNALRDDPRLPLRHRIGTLSLQFLDAAIHGRPGKIAELREHELFPHIELQRGENLELCTDYSAVDRLSVKSLEQYLERLTNRDRPLTEIESYFYDEALKHLLARGAHNSVDRFIDRFAQIQIAGNVGKTTEEYRLEWRRSLRSAQRMAPLHAILEAHFSERFEVWNDPLERPARIPRAVQPRFFFEHAEHAAFLKWQHESDAYDQTSLAFWRDAFMLWIRTGSEDFTGVLSALVEAVEHDSQGIEVIGMFFSLFDLDDPQIRKAFRECIEPLRDIDRFPETADLIDAQDVEIRVRTRNAVDIEDEVKGLRYPYFQYQGERTVLTAYLARGARKELRRYLEKMPAPALFHDLMLTTSLPALQLAGLEDEFQLTLEKGRDLLQRHRALALQLRMDFSIHEIASLAQFLPEGDSSEGDWIEETRRVLVGDTLALFELVIAETRGEWAQAENLSRRMIDDRPKHYDAYFRLGQALYKQGRKGEARAPLETFVRYCGDSPFLPSAQQWLEER